MGREHGLSYWFIAPMPDHSHGVILYIDQGEKFLSLRM